LIDLRRRGKTGRLGMCGTNGTKLPDIRAYMQQAIGDAYKDMDLTMDCWWAQSILLCSMIFIGNIFWYDRPNETVIDGQAYLEALDTFKRGDACVIFTPDDTHFDMALAAIRRGIHVMITKPAVKTLAEHRQLYDEAQKNNVLVVIEGI
jgi:D-galacturonate reductase